MTKSAARMFAAAAGAALAACTNQPAAGPAPYRAAALPATARATRSQCFLPSQVNGFSPGRYGFADVRVGASRYYRLELGGGCPNINWSMRVGIRPTGGGSFICEGYDAELIVPDPSGLQRCPIASITPITREQYYAGRNR